MPNMLGYASVAPGTASDAPADVAAYSLSAIGDGLAALLDTLGLQRAIVIGHDWCVSIPQYQAHLAAPHVLGVAGAG